MTEADPPQIDQVGEECMTSTPMRRTQPISQPSSYPINQALFSEAPPDTTQIEDRLKAMKKWAESRSHIEHLVNSDVTTPTKEDCLLVFQCLVIMWCYINNYSQRLLKRFTVYDFVNIVKNSTAEGDEYIASISAGSKYTYRTELKFNKFENKVMTYYFKRVRPLWTNGSQLLNDSFSTTTMGCDFNEVTQHFFYNSNGNKQPNISRICENFQSKMTAPHKKIRKSTDTPNAADEERDENYNPESRKKRVSHSEMKLISPCSKKRIFYSSENLRNNLSGSFNAVSIFTSYYSEIIFHLSISLLMTGSKIIFRLNNSIVRK